MTALDIFVFLLLMRRRRDRLRARLRPRGACRCSAWVVAIATLKLFHGQLPSGARRQLRDRRRRGRGARLRAAVRARLLAGEAARPGGRRADPALGARADRPRARRRLRGAQGPDRRDPVLPLANLATDMVYGAAGRPARMDDQVAHLSRCSTPAAAAIVDWVEARRNGRECGDDPPLRHDGAREARRSCPPIPSGSPCMSAGRPSTAAPISAMPGRRWCSTRSPGCSATTYGERQPRLCPQRHRRRRQDHRRGARTRASIRR